MDIKVDCLCRGNQKVYLLLEALGLDAGLDPRLRAACDGEKPVPSMLFSPAEAVGGVEGAYVAVLPDLAVVRVDLRFEACAGSGEVACSETVSLTPSQVKWRSRIAYRTQAEACAAIRDYDERHSDGRLAAEGIDCMDDWASGEDILRIAVSSLYAGDRLSVKVLDRSANEYGGAPILMGSRLLPSRREEGEKLQETVFSIRMEKPQDDLFVVLHSEDHPELDCFVLWSRGAHDALRARTGRRMLDAGRDPYYPEWFGLHKATEAVLARQAATTLPHTPLFSIVVPLFKTPEKLFREMLASVLAQSYARWELILVNASPEDEALRACVSEACAADGRISCVALEANLGISENTNAGVAVARGDFVCFFDHDDLLEPNALFEYAKATCEHPDADVLYCDEDVLRDGSLGEGGRLCEPYFKPDFNLDLLRSVNYVCHLMTIRRSLLGQLAPNTRDFDGAQDHNLLLEAAERARYVHHVPRVLYHWRATAGSVAGSDQSKPYAWDAAVRAVQAHMDRMGIACTVERGPREYSCRVVYELPEAKPKVSIVIPNKDHQSVLKTCLDSVFEKTTYPDYEVVIVDNGSTEPELFAYYDELARARAGRVTVVSYDHPFNYAAQNNLGVSAAKGDYVVLLNNDTEVITGSWIEGMLGACLREDVGAVGARLYYPDDTIQHAGVFYVGDDTRHFCADVPRSMTGYAFLAGYTQEVSAVTAACMMVSRADFEAVGGFSEEFPVELNDVDFCFKLTDAGKLIVYEPNVELYHHESVSRCTDDDYEQRLKVRRWKALLNERWAEKLAKRDPYLNPNLADDAAKCQYRGF